MSEKAKASTMFTGDDVIAAMDLDDECVTTWGREVFDHAARKLNEAVCRWRVDDSHLLLTPDDLIERDDYGVPGSDFYRCRLCDAESGAGLLNKGIPHRAGCRLAEAPSDGNVLHGYVRTDEEVEAACFRWLTEDLADREERERRNELLRRMPTMSYAAVCAQINHEWQLVADKACRQNTQAAPPAANPGVQP